MDRKISFILSYWWCMLLLVLGLIPVCLGSKEGKVSEKENRTLQVKVDQLQAYIDGLRTGLRAIKRGGQK